MGDVNYFDEPIASRYDASISEEFDPAVIVRTVDFLASLAGDGTALEFAIGTGRIGWPLSQRGVRVCGIERSEPMLAQLRRKEGSDAIDVTMGDMRTTRVDGEFALVYLVYNTINNLLTQDDQVQCFENAAAHLAAGGRFVIEVGVPQLQRLPPGETFRPFQVTDVHLGFDEFDIANQGLVSHHYFIGRDGKVLVHPQPFRYVWPAELDLMARIAGMTLDQRWSDWDRAPFTSESRKHISVWRKPS